MLEKMNADFKYTQEKNTIALFGRLIDYEQLELLGKEIDTIVQNNEDVVLDFKNLEYINSTGLNFLVKSLTKIRNNGNELYIKDIPKSVKNLFIITKLNSIFNIIDHEA